MFAKDKPIVFLIDGGIHQGWLTKGSLAGDLPEGPQGPATMGNPKKVICT